MNREASTGFREVTGAAWIATTVTNNPGAYQAKFIRSEDGW
jgi:hypothetical protein